MSFVITNTATVAALRVAYNAGKWQEAYQLVMNAITTLELRWNYGDMISIAAFWPA